jgi:toxin ParE1/3/4
LSGGGRFRLSAGADADVESILDETLRRFGTTQYETYAALIEAAFQLVADEPTRPGSKNQGDLMPEMRSFPVSLAARRRGASAHVLFYVPDRSVGGGIFVVRVLHQAMDPRAHLPEDAG